MSMFQAIVSEAGEFNNLEDGCYEAVVTGLRGFEGTKYQSDEVQDKIQVVFQVQDSEGVLHYLTSKPMTNVMNDKSNLFKMLSGLTGYGLDKFKDGFDLRQLVNAENPVKCQLTIKTVTSKKDPNKSFNEIDGYLKAKKNQKNTFVPDDKAPAWLNQNVKEVLWMPGLSFLPPRETAPAKATMPPAPATTLGDSSAFFNQAPAMPGQPSPYVPPMTKQQQQAYLAQQNGTYVPPAAPAPQQAWPAPQAPQVQVEDPSDLPF